MGLLLLSSGSSCVQNFVCTLKDWSLCFPSELWKGYNRIPLAHKARFPGDSQSLCQIPRLGSLMQGSEPSQQCENFISIIVPQSVHHPPGGFGIFILSWLLPSYRLAATSSLSLDVGYLSFGGFQHAPVAGCSPARCNFGALTGGDEHTGFYSTILNWNPRLVRKLRWWFGQSPRRKGMSTRTPWSMPCAGRGGKGTASNGCSDKSPHASSRRNSGCHRAGDAKPEFSVTGLKPSCWQGHPPDVGSKGKTLS